MLFATICQDWSPTGWTVWFSLACGLAGIAFTWGQKRKQEAILAKWTTAALLAQLALSLAWSIPRPWSPREMLGFFYKCYYAQLDMATIVSIAFGIGFAVAALRIKDGFVRLLGAFLLLPFGWFVFRILERIRWLDGTGS